MIFVTVGTTMPFPSLLQEVDRLAAAGLFGDQKLICQIGQSEVDLRHCEVFRFRPVLDDLMQEADLVITHAGSTVFSLINYRQKFIAFPNPIGADSHQLTLLKRLDKLIPLFWSADVSDLAKLYEKAKENNSYEIELPRLADHLSTYIT